MSETALSRSSVEAYFAIILTVTTVVFPMTWWFCLILTILVGGLTVDIVMRAKIHPKLKGPYKFTAAFICSIIICFVGSSRAAYIYNYNDSLENERVGPYPTIKFSLIKSDQSYLPLVVIKATDGPLVNYGLNFKCLISDYILSDMEENKFISGKTVDFIIKDSEFAKSKEVRSVMSVSDPITIGIPEGKIYDFQYNQLAERKLYLYWFVLIDYRDKAAGKPFFARSCARFVPRFSQLPCIHRDFIKADVPIDH